MNTLSRATTARFYPDSDTYYRLRRHWSELMRSPRCQELSAAHHLLYLALLGKDWRKAFTPITNPRKLANGAFYGWPLFFALWQLKMPVFEAELLAPFDGLVTPAMLADLRPLLPPQPDPYKLRPADFAPGRFPFEAYQTPEVALATNFTN
jgi:hypothetical protein